MPVRAWPEVCQALSEKTVANSLDSGVQSGTQEGTRLQVQGQDLFFFYKNFCRILKEF